MQVQNQCMFKQGYAGARPPPQTVAAETIEREYCYRLHSEWPLLDALHAQLDHLSTHERRKRLRLLQVSQTIYYVALTHFTLSIRQQAHNEEVLEAQSYGWDS